jgi:hypothetical protein
MPRIRLVKKFAESIDGIDLSGRVVGASFTVDVAAAQLLVAEGWAVPVTRKKRKTTDSREVILPSSPPPTRASKCRLDDSH